MTKSTFVLEATSRSALGKGASRRLRRLEDRVPAVVYGNDTAAVSIQLEHKDIYKLSENEAFYSSILDLKIDNKAQKVVLKDIQRHPYKKIIQHLDFQRISDKKAINMHVPLHFLNQDTCPAVKLASQGVSHNLIEVEVKCLPKDLPEFIEVDLASLEKDQVVHVSDIKFPKGVEAVTPATNAVATAHKVRSAAAEDDSKSEDTSESQESGDKS